MQIRIGLLHHLHYIIYAQDAGGEIICEDIEKYANGSYVRVFEGEAGPTDRQIIDSTVCSRTGGLSTARPPIDLASAI